MAKSSISSAYRWVLKESLQIIPAVIYFCLAFNLIYFTVGLTLEPGEPRFFNAWIVTLGGLIVGKVLIIANALPFINAFPNKPLIYNIVWKLFLYSFLTFVFWSAETIFHLWDKYTSWPSILLRYQHELHSPDFFACQLWLYAVLLVFIIFNEFMSILGRDRVLKILFG